MVLLLAATLLLLLLLALPWILNRPAVGEALLREFEQRTGQGLSVETWQVRIFPSIRLELINIQVQDRVSAATLFSADRLEITLQILPLLGGRIVGKDLIVDRPHVTVHRSHSGAWSVGETERDMPFDGSAPSDRPARPFAWLQMVRNLLVTRGAITVIDGSGLTLRTPIRVVVTGATLSSDIPGRHARLQLSGEIPQERDTAAFTLDGALTLNPDGSDPQAEGDLRLHRIDVRHLLSLWTGLGPLSDGFVGPARLTAHLRLSPRAEGYGLAADEWKVELSDLSLQGTAEVVGLGTSRALYSATLSAPPVTLARALSQIPTAWVSNQVRSQVAEHGIDGLVTMQSMVLSGLLAPGSRPSVSGLIEVRNGRFTLDPRYPPLEALSGRIVYDMEQIRITGLRAQCGPVRLAGEDLLITQWVEDPHIDVRILGTAPLTGVVDSAQRIEGFSLLRDLLTRMQPATGEVEMVAHVMGQPAGGKRLAVVDVLLMLHDAGFRSALLSAPVRQVQARIHAKPMVVTIEHLEGLLGPAKLEGHGTVTMTDGTAYSDVKLNLSAEATELWSLLEKEIDLGPRPDVGGTMRMQATVTGVVGEPRVKGRLDLESVTLRIPNVLTKPLHAPAAVEFDVRLSGGKVLTIRHMDLLFPPIKIAGAGTVHLSGGMDFAADVSFGTLSVKKLPAGIVLGPIKAGTLDAALHVEGQMKERSSWRLSGLMRFDRGAIEVEGLNEPIRDAFVTLRFDQDDIQIQRMAFHLGDGDLRVSGSITHWAEAPKARLVVESSQLDVAAFVPSHRGSSAPHRDRPVRKTWWSDGRLEAFVFVDHVYYQKFLLTDLSSRVVWDHGLLTVDRISGDTNEGHVAGQVKMRGAGQRVRQAQSTFRMNGVPIERLLTLVEEKPVMTGWLTTTGKVQMEFERTGPLLGGVTSRRPIQIVIEDGRIYRVPVISKLLSVMNLPALLQGEVDLVKDGLPLDRLKVVLSANNGVLHAKEFLLDSPVLKISGTGRYDLMADEFDMVLATSPLGSYSAMLKRVPLFGHLLAGNRQGFDTAVFELKGSASNPALRYLPAESLMTGVKGTAQLAFDILANAITLPQKAYSMIEDEADEGEREDF